MSNFTALFSLALFLFSFGCKNEAPVSANLYVRYEQQEQQLKAEASFMKGDSSQTAESIVFQGGVSFMSSGMKTRKLPGGMVRYNFEQNGKLPANLVFSFKDETGTEQNFTPTLLATEDFQFQDSIVSKAKGGILTYTGKPLEPTEKLVLLFTGAGNVLLNFEVPGPSSRPEVIIPPGQLANLSLGNGQLSLVRTRTEVQRKGRFTAFVTTEFYSSAKNFQLVE